MANARDVSSGRKGIGKRTLGDVDDSHTDLMLEYKDVLICSKRANMEGHKRAGLMVTSAVCKTRKDFTLWY